MGIQLMEQARLAGRREVRHDRDGLRVPEVHAGAVPRGRPLERLPGGDERPLRPGQEDAPGPGPGVPRAVRLQRHPPAAGQPLRPGRQLRPAQLARDPGADQEVRRRRRERARTTSTSGGRARPPASSSTSTTRPRGSSSPPSATTAPEPVNLGVGREITIRELVELIAEAHGLHGRDPLGPDEAGRAAATGARHEPRTRAVRVRGPDAVGGRAARDDRLVRVTARSRLVTEVAPVPGGDPAADSARHASGAAGRIGRGLAANIGGMGVTLLIQLVSVPVFLAAWGVPTYGEWLVLSAVPTYVALSDLSFSSVAGNSMVMLVAQGKRDGRGHPRSAPLVHRHRDDGNRGAGRGRDRARLRRSLRQRSSDPGVRGPGRPRRAVPAGRGRQPVRGARRVVPGRWALSARRHPSPAWAAPRVRLPSWAPSSSGRGQARPRSRSLPAAWRGSGCPGSSCGEPCRGPRSGRSARTSRRSASCWRPDSRSWRSRSAMRCRCRASRSSSGPRWAPLPSSSSRRRAPSRASPCRRWARSTTRSGLSSRDPSAAAISMRRERSFAAPFSFHSRSRCSLVLGLALFGVAIIRWWTHGLVDPPVLLLFILLLVIVANSTWYTLSAVLAATNRHKRLAVVYLVGHDRGPAGGRTSQFGVWAGGRGHGAPRDRHRDGRVRVPGGAARGSRRPRRVPSGIARCSRGGSFGDLELRSAT